MRFLHFFAPCSGLLTSPKHLLRFLRLFVLRSGFSARVKYLLRLLHSFTLHSSLPTSPKRLLRFLYLFTLRSGLFPPSIRWKRPPVPCRGTTGGFFFALLPSTFLSSTLSLFRHSLGRKILPRLLFGEIIRPARGFPPQKRFFGRQSPPFFVDGPQVFHQRLTPDRLSIRPKRLVDLPHPGEQIQNLPGGLRRNPGIAEQVFPIQRIPAVIAVPIRFTEQFQQLKPKGIAVVSEAAFQDTFGPAVRSEMREILCDIFADSRHNAPPFQKKSVNRRQRGGPAPPCRVWRFFCGCFIQRPSFLQAGPCKPAGPAPGHGPVFYTNAISIFR